jgi:selenocysteine lyase/cysteine desulfurase
MAAVPSTAHKEFSPEGTYLNTATYGLPPRRALEAMAEATGEWRHGRTGFDGWDRSVGRARAAFARLAGVPAANVAIGPQVSVFVGMVAASLPRGTRVAAAEGDFTSALFPFLAQGHDVSFVPLDRLAEADADLVVASAVQSSDGRLADLDALAACGARTLIDATQACGWLPLDAGRFDFLVCGGYKWLLNPRGTAFLYVRDPEAVTPVAAGWYAGDEPMETLYGGPLRLAPDARRLDVSPAWLSWVGAAPALELIEEVGVEAIHAHDLALANRFREAVGMPPGDSAIVSLDLDPGAEARLRGAGVMCAGRGGLLRLSFHLYNNEADADLAASRVREGLHR